MNEEELMDLDRVDSPENTEFYDESMDQGTPDQDPGGQVTTNQSPGDQEASKSEVAEAVNQAPCSEGQELLPSTYSPNTN